MTSLNAVVITARLIISVVVQRIIAVTIGEVGISKIGQLRNLMEIITSSSSLGVFNGVVKYTSEFKDQSQKLHGLFNTSFVFILVGASITSFVLFFNASWITLELFESSQYTSVIKCLALLPIFVGVNRVFHAFINGVSAYKKYAKIDFFSYVLSIALLLVGLYFYSLKGVLFSIIFMPIIQIAVIIYVFGATLKKHIKIKAFKLEVPLRNQLLAFTLMSFFSTILLNYIELDVRTTIIKRISVNESGYWTAMNFISKNYMIFSSTLFTMYVIPKFATIYQFKSFKKEVLHIYKTILPIFGFGMLLVYLCRSLVIDIVYPNFTGMEPLFKWQLLGDFVRLGTLVISHQFLAKKMLKSFVFTELISLGLFYGLSKLLMDTYGLEGVVMAHFFRYIIYFVFVVLMIWLYFKKESLKTT